MELRTARESRLAAEQVLKEEQDSINEELVVQINSAVDSGAFKVYTGELPNSTVAYLVDLGYSVLADNDHRDPGCVIEW